MSTLENPKPKDDQAGNPAIEAGIFLESQTADIERPDLLGLVVVGEAVPPLSDIDNPIDAVRKIGQHSRKFGELVINASAGGHTTMHTTEEAWDHHMHQEAQRVDDELRAIYAPPPAGQTDL